MKVRAQRTHLMGTSNRAQDNQAVKTNSVFDRSFMKSKSLYYKSNEQPSLLDNSERKNPFLGSHNEFQTSRFDKMNVKPYKESKMILAPTQKIINFGSNLNKEVEGIRKEFNGKKINMHKLNELKRAFVKNNRDRRNLREYYDNFSQNGEITVAGMKRIVKEYGFDVNDDQAKLIFRLTNKQSSNKDGLNLGGFIDLMTKEDIYYKTLKLSSDSESNEKISNFSQKVHTILRNKFPKLKQALKIYISRGEQVDEERYRYVMKKMDITNLVMTQKQRREVFEKYSSDGIMNVEGLICAIAEQEFGRKVKIDANLDFVDQIRLSEENQQSKDTQLRKFTLKSLSSLQYENQLKRAQNILYQLRKLKKESNKNIIGQISSGKTKNRKEIIKNTENLLKNNGLNFRKEDYDAFGAYLDFDIDDQISQKKLQKYFFEENQNDARERFQRKLRSQAPKPKGWCDDYCDEEVAAQSINRLKSHKMNPENSTLFKYFDKDKDGYVSTQELTDGLKRLEIFENWQVNNLVSYFDSSKKGSIQFNDFTFKMNKKQNEELPLLKSKQSSSCRQWSGTKKTFIATHNQPSYQRPTKYSAWPQRLTQSDLSLLQPPSNSAMHITEGERFSQRKEDYGSKQKQISRAIAETRCKRITDWNLKLNEKMEVVRKAEEDRAAANNYFKRLTQETYEERCHR